MMVNVYIVLSVHSGVKMDTRGGQQKKFLPFGHGRGLIAFLTVLAYRTSLFRIGPLLMLLVFIKRAVLADLSITLRLAYELRRNG